MFKVIRASADYGTVLVEGDNNKFYKCDILVYIIKGVDFVEITEPEVMRYFSGHADVMGYGECPEEAFSSLEAVSIWREKLARAFREGSDKRYPPLILNEREWAELLLSAPPEIIARQDPELIERLKKIVGK